MRILQITHRYPPQTGGVETHVSELSRRLVDRGHRVTVLTADAGSGDDRRERRDGVLVRRMRSLAPGGAIHLAPGVVPAVRTANADVVHAHNYHSLPLALAALTHSGDSDVPFVATPHYHGESAVGLRDRLLDIYKPLGRWALRGADAVLAVSEWERRRLAADLGVDARVVPNGLDVGRFRDAVPERRDRPYLLTVSRLEPYKGVHFVIRALACLPDHELVVVGAGPERESLERLAADRGVADRVAFLGYVEAGRLPGLYAGAEAFLTMSTVEAYGLTVAEALASGTPCVVREVGALVDWTDRDDCIGVEATDPETLASAVKKAVDCPAPTSPLPTWDSVVDAVCACYENLLFSDRVTRV